MKFNGRFSSGKFIPNRSHEQAYKLFIAKCEQSDLRITVEINKEVSTSSAQNGLFFVVVQKVATASGSTVEKVIRSLFPFRLIDSDGSFKEFSEYTTEEFSEFIERSLAHLNDVHDLHITIQQQNGKAHVIDASKED